MHDPALIILDEPTNGLDPQGIADMRNLILKLSNEMGKTVLISSHLLSEIELIANRMIIIHKGKKMVEGKVTDLLDPAHSLIQIETHNNNAAKEKLKQTKWNTYLQEDKQLRLMMNKEEVPQLISRPGGNGCCECCPLTQAILWKIIFYHLQPSQVMLNLLRIELFKISRRPRTYIAFAAITAIALIFQFAFKADGQSYMNLMLQSVKDTFDV